MDENHKNRIFEDQREMLDQVEKAILENIKSEALPIERKELTDNHPTIMHGEALAKHLESVMAEYSKRVAIAAELIRRTVRQLAEDQTKIEQHLDAMTKSCKDISKIGSHDLTR